MNRFLQYFNLVGILALAGLCCVQWKTNRQLNLQAGELEKTRLEQLVKLAEQDKQMKGYVADLDDFRQRLTLSESALKEVQDKLVTMTQQRDALTAERDQLKASLDQWAAAVAQRDAAIKQASEQIQKIVADRNDAVAKFNDLADKYNAVVKDLDKARSKQ